MLLEAAAATAASGNLLGMQNLKPHFRPTESETQGWGLATCVNNSSRRLMQLKFENHWSGKTRRGPKWTEGIGNVRIGLEFRRVMKEHSE